MNYPDCREGEIATFPDDSGGLPCYSDLLMALQAGLPILDFSLLDGVRKEEYFAAVRAGMDRDYQPMKRLFLHIIEMSLKVS